MEKIRRGERTRREAARRAEKMLEPQKEPINKRAKPQGRGTPQNARTIRFGERKIEGMMERIPQEHE